MNYQQTLDYLYSFLDASRRHGRTPPEWNIARTNRLLQAIGDPQSAFPSVIVAGTKGKGSTSAFIEAIARAAGLRVGLWTSPHLHSYRERIQVDRQLIPRGDLVRLVTELRPTLEAFDPAPSGAPSTFEIGLLLALRYFAEQSVDLAVLEVGLGGRYDNTNAVTPILSVITSISYDHMDFLGETLGEIAWNKAGIIKPGVPAITIPQPDEAFAVIAAQAAAVDTPLYVAAPGAHSGETLRLEQVCATQPHAILTLKGVALEPALPGIFQRENVRLAAGAALLLRNRFALSDHAISSGVAQAHWPGRLEIIAGAPPIALDGAHNGDSLAKLCASLAELFPGRQLTFVLGSSQDKDLSRMLDVLVPAASAIVLTRSQHPRALADLDHLAALITQHAVAGQQPIVAIEPQIEQALERAQALTPANGLICVTGSLFVVAAARETLGIAGETE